MYGGVCSSSLASHHTPLHIDTSFSAHARTHTHSHTHTHMHTHTCAHTHTYAHAHTCTHTHTHTYAHTHTHMHTHDHHSLYCQLGPHEMTAHLKSNHNMIVLSLPHTSPFLTHHHPPPRPPHPSLCSPAAKLGQH